MPGDPVRGGLDWRLPSLIRNTVFLACLTLSLTITAVAFSSYQEHNAYTDHCKASAHTGEQGCKAEKPFGESVFADPVVFFAAITALFTGGLIFVGIAQAGLFWWQLHLIREGLTDTEEAANAAKEQAKLARESLIASQRAWIKAELAPDGHNVVQFVAEGVKLAVQYRFSNIGNSPAVNASVHLWIVAHGEERLIEAKCDALQRDPTPKAFTTFTLFPGESIPESTGAVLIVTEVSGDMQALIRAVKPDGDGQVAWLQIGGCISYTFPTDPKGHHQTRLLYDIVYDFGPVPLGILLDPAKVKLHRAIAETGYHAS